MSAFQSRQLRHWEKRNIYIHGKPFLTMVNMGVVKMSSKGQIVIPSEMRMDLQRGAELIIIKDDGRFILNKIENISEKMKDDIEFARRTEAALQAYEKGKFTSYSKKAFLKRLDKW